MTRPMTSSEAMDCSPVVSFDQWDNGITSLD